jgi:hypothetical protein
MATKAVAPTQASIAARKSGLLPYTLSATIYRKGSIPSCLMFRNIAAANCGFV